MMVLESGGNESVVAYSREPFQHSPNRLMETREIYGRHPGSNQEPS